MEPEETWTRFDDELWEAYANRFDDWDASTGALLLVSILTLLRYLEPNPDTKKSPNRSKQNTRQRETSGAPQ